MEQLIVLIWFVLVVAVTLALTVIVIILFDPEVESYRILVAFPIAIFLHILFACMSIFPMFVMVYAGAHTQPGGQAMNWSLRGTFLLIEGIYAMLAFSFGTYLAGREKPWPIPVKSPLP